MKTNKGFLRTLRISLLILVALVIYAYGFQVTKVSLSEINEPRRQASFFRILRALGHPDIFEYDQDEFIVEAPFYMPCPESGVEVPEPDQSQPYMVIEPACADAKSEITIKGFNFEPSTNGPLNFVPPSGVKLQLGSIESDSQGHFEVKVKLPNRKPLAEAQYIQAVTRRNVGTPHFTQTAKDTWAKIIETVFLALLATTFGTILAIPISFFAARNLMKDVTSTMASVSLTILAWPIGVFFGLEAAQWANKLSLTLNGNLGIYFAGLVLSPIATLIFARVALPQEDHPVTSVVQRVGRLVALVIAALLGILFLFLLSQGGMRLGNALAEPLKIFGFLGSFMANLGEILGTILTIVVALATGATFGSLGGKFGQKLSERTPKPLLFTFNLILGGAAGATFLVALGYVVEWLYQLNDPLKTVWVPAGVGVLLGIILVLRNRKQDALPVGLTTYYVTRTILNTLRSIEAFIMAIIFVALVSTGPFAGVLALSLHTVAALAKLYSEQVESISTGPIEAIRATGATRLQTIIYGVIPQIVPPYISFTMYRWDINVRMSTIIGFAGGGGIGFLLQQNINLLNYRAASVQMLAITIVVALMDNISSRLRERVV